jgi:outer membrane protein TolC
MNKLYLILILLLLYDVANAQDDTLTIDKSIEIALKNNPQVKIAESNYESSAANLLGVRSAIYPQVSLQTNWTNNGGTSFVGPNAFAREYQNYSTGFQGQMLIFDFGKTYSKISAASDLKSASEQDYIGAKENLILDTYNAYFTYLQAHRLKNVSEEVVRQADEHLQQANAFYKVGTKPQFDVLKAQSDLANAKVNLITADNNIQIARLQLENELNIKLEKNFLIKDNLDYNKEVIELNDALASAKDKRPEIISSKFRVEASKSGLTSAWTSNLPAINATGGYNWRTLDLKQQFVDSWNLGLSISLPIFQGFALQSGIDLADANLKNAQAQDEFINQTVSLDVQQQYSNWQQAGAKIDAAKLFVNQALETLKIAEGRYKQEVGSTVDVTDARVAYFNAQIIYIQSLYDYQISYVRLQRAMGILK